MAFSTLTIRFLAAAFAIILFISTPAAAITCSDVIKQLSPCVNYLKSGSGAPPVPCCKGASSLASAAKSKADKQTACGCLKTAANSIKPKLELAMSLPGKCGVSLPFEVSPSVDCSK
ncbi:non-specific lipid-transfer protein 1 [Phtheirospermum japonicum]|uniref:Non-specific lipid-transfer protein n=1 Tax=Phtheirospermum japonicum TaxID=374723 RepID=A0A830C2Q5_9LAMI|nr:non-specific lipid-transfer protein 1 [Phtheirospermum japonicum]